MKYVMVGAWLIAGAGLVACVPKEMPQARDGRALYMDYCSVCHGETAKGDGEMARAMSKPPKDLTLISLRHGDTFPRAKVLSYIDGYARSDLDGPQMPEFGELLEGDLIPLDTGDGKMTPTPRKLVALLEYLESVQVTR
ncbi:cytochrome c [Salipiger sp. 1_MG-2023]|uniref:c-type cytochrome n=1 Tax=Salipiger sp. 1_MG-2023 TaxID=3062665 RepID=UPI0026E25A59|nr:cytochrome c [Salipiger sp. 1_MG-2023]MDO6586228.1 cytochrome c [Salipiger sp. 1_MG-2023]